MSKRKAISVVFLATAAPLVANAQQSDGPPWRACDELVVPPNPIHRAEVCGDGEVR